MGGNMGWPHREGSVAGPVAGGTGPFVAPFAEYGHIDGRSAIGGYVYRGSIEALQGKYIFGEFSWGTGALFSSTGRLFYMDVYDENGDLLPPEVRSIQEMTRSKADCSNSYVAGFCSFDSSLLAFGIDDDGELYAVGLRSGRMVTYQITDASFLSEGDYDEDGAVDDDDYALWKQGFGNPVKFGTTVQIGYGSDGARDGMVDAADYVVWRKFFGASPPGAGGLSNIPEPMAVCSALIGTMALLGATARCRRAAKR